LKGKQEQEKARDLTSSSTPRCAIQDHFVQVVGPIPLSELCQKSNIPVTARGTVFFFVDSEGTGNANGADEQLGKALAAVSAITTIRIAMRENRLCDDSLDGLRVLSNCNVGK
jgi:hypothetical protein